jgi:hypothetical protein
MTVKARWDALVCALRCAVLGHRCGPPFAIGRALHVRCAECGWIGDGVQVQRRLLRVSRKVAS